MGKMHNTFLYTSLDLWRQKGNKKYIDRLQLLVLP